MSFHFEYEREENTFARREREPSAMTEKGNMAESDAPYNLQSGETLDSYQAV